MLTRALAALLGVALLSACGSNGSTSPALQPPTRTTSCGARTPDEPAKDGSLRAFYPTTMRHEVSGDVEAMLEGEGLIDVCEILGDNYPQGTHFLTVSAGQYDLTLEDGTVLLWSADLVPGLYSGPGTYTIDTETAPGIAGGSGIRSAAYLRFTGPTGGPEGFAEYRELVEPCTLTITADAASGSVVCPALGLDGDPTRTIAWTFTWERLPA